MFGGVVLILGGSAVHPLPDHCLVPELGDLCWPGRLLIFFGLGGRGQSFKHRNQMLDVGKGLLQLEVTVWDWPGQIRIWQVTVWLWPQGALPFLMWLTLQRGLLLQGRRLQLVLLEFFLNTLCVLDCTNSPHMFNTVCLYSNLLLTWFSGNLFITTGGRKITSLTASWGVLALWANTSTT